MDQTLFPSLKNHFLIALPGLRDGIFTHSITYLCEHDDKGAMGIVINRPIDMEVDEILEQLDIAGQIFEHHEPVFAGGPVHTDRGFVLHRRDNQDWEASIAVTDTVALTTSLDILEAIALNRGPSQSLIALGYAGWDAGQLEEEIQSNTWLTLPANDEVLFNVPSDKKVDAALAILGIKFSQIGSDSGHA
ncbi:YqgE/AlgH family protein [Zhongshania sp.]|uniref:YqgE/AlgH family protein n=1 Tax=Zhongshania sp. TaxID=1971902 RepID=UPI003562872E